MITFRLGRPSINLFNYHKKVIFFLWLFLLVFPKGGIKLGGVPITIGYILLGITTLFALFRTNWKIQYARLMPLLCLIPFQIISIISFLANGYTEIGMTISFFISFVFIPISLLLILSNDIETLDLSSFYNLFKIGIRIIAIYGIFLFFYKQYTGKFLEIPFLTTNLSDLGMLENKCNARQSCSKLISTYNNGNIYGVNLLMLLPLYCILEKNFWFRSIVKLSILMTFCRTAWIGLLFSELCFDLLISKNTKVLLAKLVGSVILFSLSIIALSIFFPFPLSFLFDIKMAGRMEQYQNIKELTIFAPNPIGPVSETVYFSILNYFGVTGLLSFILAMIGPLLLNCYYFTPLRTAICLGIVNYLIIAAADGAILLIPTMTFYWFLISLFFKKNLEPENNPIRTAQ